MRSLAHLGKLRVSQHATFCLATLGLQGSYFSKLSYHTF